MYVYGLDHGELGAHFLVLTYFTLMCEGRSSLYDRWTSQDHGKMVTTVERLERTVEKWSFFVQTTVDFGFLLVLKNG